MAADEKRGLKKTSDVIMDTRFPNEDVYLYEKRQNRAIVEEETAIYEYIYVYVKLGKINILIRGIFLYWF